MRADETSFTRFLNVDLDVECDHDVAVLVKALSPKLLVIHETDRFVSFETNLNSDKLKTCLEAFIQAIAGLSPEARSVWDGCTRRTANIGIQAGSQPYSAHFPIEHETIAALAAIGCGVELTVYAAFAPSARASAEASS